jgi:hypothetical protein
MSSVMRLGCVLALFVPAMASAAAPPAAVPTPPLIPNPPPIPNAKEPEPVFINQRNFTIPIRVPPDRQDEVRALLLYCSRDQGKTWYVPACVTPDRKGFEFSTDRDGLYYFSIVVIDQEGRIDPPDVYREPPGQKICIDTARPEVTATAERDGDEVVVNWSIREEHLDAIKLEYEVGGQKETIEVPGILKSAQSCTARFTPTRAGPVTIRLSATDHALNETTVERTVAAAPPSAPAPVRPLPADDEPVRQDGFAVPRETVPPKASGGALPPLQIVNKRQQKLDFDVTRVGPSGVGGVDVYVSTDEGATWEKTADPNVTLPDPGTNKRPLTGSVTVDLPKDGVIFGFYLVVKSAAGRGKEPPRPGDAPQVRIELDTTQPEAELYAPQPDSQRPDCLLLTWKASDRNIAPNPISLEWSPRPDGPGSSSATRSWRTPAATCGRCRRTRRRRCTCV